MKKRYVAVFRSMDRLSLVGREYAVLHKGMFFVGFLANAVTKTSELYEKAHTILPEHGRALKSYDGSIKKSDCAKAPIMKYVDHDRYSIV